MVPNKFVQRLQQALKLSPPLFRCPVCVRQLKSKGGLTKHLNATHPGFDGDIDQGTPSADNEVRFSHAPDTPSHSQLQSSPSQAVPSLNPSLDHPKLTKKHRRFRFTIHGGFSLSYESVDLRNPTDQEDYCVHSDEDRDSLSRSSSSSRIASPAFPTSPVAPISLEEDYRMHSDNDADPPSPTSPPSSYVPFPLENAPSEDFWYTDMDRGYAADGHNHSSSSSNTSRFPVQDQAQTNCPTVPKQHYSRIYHPKLNGVYFIYSAQYVCTRSTHREDMRRRWKQPSTQQPSPCAFSPTT